MRFSVWNDTTQVITYLNQNQWKIFVLYVIAFDISLAITTADCLNNTLCTDIHNNVFSSAS